MQTEEIKTICRMCLMGCGIIAHVEDGCITRIEGNPDFPINKGGLCPKGLSATQLVYDPKRLQHPLKRMGERGEGKWERISWKEALSITAERVNKIKEREGAQAIAFFKGQAPAWDNMFDLWTRLGMCFGSPNLATPANVCFFPRRTTYVTVGDYAESDFDSNNGIIILWGYNAATSSLPASCRRIFDARERGAKIVVIDPVFTQMASKADLYLRIRPGTDLALALGMANIMIQEDLYDKDFIEKWTVGFGQLREHVTAYPPDRVAEITGVPVDRIYKLARMYGKIKPGLIAIGNGVEQSTNSIQTIRGLSILQALGGNLDIPGGNIFDPRAWPMGKANPTMMLDRIENYAEKSLSQHPLYAQFETSNRTEVVDAILTEKPYPVKGILTFGTNFVTTTAQSTKVISALKKLDFLAVHDLYMTKTAEYADIVFPCASFLESDDYVFWRMGSARHGRPQNMSIHVWQPKVIPPIGECGSNWDFVAGLAHALGLGEFFPWENLEAYVDWELKEAGMVDFDVNDLKESLNGIIKVYSPAELYKKYEKRGFKTPSGKVELYSSILENFGYDPLPIYREPAESPISRPEICNDYPLICNNGMKPGVHTHSQFHDLPWIKGIFPEPYAAINPETATRYNIQNGEKVIVKSPRGQITLPVKITKTIPSGMVFIPHGWEEPLYNDLTDDHEVDPISGGFSTRAFLCTVQKV